MRDMEQERYLLGINSFDTSDLIDLYQSLDEDSALIRGQLRQAAEKRQRNLEVQYESLLGQSRS